jgi:multidrug efflux pump subunit AcrA (membrane-fusion protein)
VVDTHDGTIRGHVARVDPAVLNGTVAVDIALDDSLPKVARPDLSVDGTIQIERLHDVVYVGRPSEGSSEGPVSLFRLDRDGHAASRVAVQLGRGSASTVEVRSGLGPGDQVILSDMSRWEKATRVRIP